MVLESVDLSACLFLSVAGSLVYIIVVGKSLSTMSLYFHIVPRVVYSHIFAKSRPIMNCINLLFLLGGGSSLIFVAGEQHKR